MSYPLRRFTIAEKQFLRKLSDDIKKRPEAYSEGAEYLESRYSPDALFASHHRQWAATPVFLRNSQPVRESYRLSKCLVTAFNDLLYEGFETADDDLNAYDIGRLQAILVLTWLLTDKDADKAPLGARYGPWEGRALARWMSLDRLADGSEERSGQSLPNSSNRTQWMKLAKRARKVFRRQDAQVVGETAAGTADGGPSLPNSNEKVGSEQPAPNPAGPDPDAHADLKHGAAPGKGMTWQQAMKAAEDHCARNPFPGVNALAKIVRQATRRTCSPATIRKAIARSAKLRAKLAEHEAQRKSVSARAMSEAAAESAKQSRERDPAEAASTDEIFRALVEQAKEQERARLNAMTDSQRKELVAAMDEDSIRELFKPLSR